MAFSELTAGNVHLVYFTGESEFHGLDRVLSHLESRGVRAFHTPKLNTIFYSWNLSRDNVWTRNPQLRRAVYRAVKPPTPRVLLVPAAGLLPPGLPDQGRRPGARDHDPREARELLRRAGFPGGKGLPPLRVAAMGQTELFKESIVDALAAIGIDTEVSLTPPGRYWKAVENGEFEFFRDGWIADYPDPENFFQLFYSKSSSNHTRYADSEYDRLFEQLQARQAGDPRRSGISEELERILSRDLPSIFLYHEKSYYLVRNEVRGIEASINPLERKFYEYAWLQPEPQQ